MTAFRNRLEAHNDFLINQKAEEEIRAILDHLAAQDRALADVHAHLLEVVASGNQAGRGIQ